MSRRLFLFSLVTVGFATAWFVAGESTPRPRLALAQPAPGAERFFQSGGAMNCAQAMGDVLWLCSGPRLLAVDVSDPAKPSFLGQSDVLPGVLQAIVIEEARSRAWVVAGETLVGLDLQDPERPAALGRLHVGLANIGYDARPPMAMAGGRLWLPSPEEGIAIGIDLQDPRHPAIGARVVVRSAAGGAVMALAGRGDRLYALARVGPRVVTEKGQDLSQYQVQVFALSPGDAPQRIQSELAPAALHSDTATLRWDGDLLWARTARDRLLAWRDEGQGLQLALDGVLEECHSPTAFTIRGGQAYAACGWSPGTGFDVKAFDLTQAPPFPWLVAGPRDVDDPASASSAIAVIEGVLWVGDDVGRLRGFDVGTGGGFPTMRPTGQLSLVGELDSLNWDEARRRLLVSTGDGLMPVDADDPGRPSVGPVLAGGFHVGRLDADGDRLAMSHLGKHDSIDVGLQLRDLRDPARAPLLLDGGFGEPDLSWIARPMDLDGDRLLLALRGDLSLWDWPVGSTTGPTERLSWPMSGRVRSISLGDGQAAMVEFERDETGEVWERILVSVVDLATAERRGLVLPAPANTDLQADLRFTHGSLWLALADGHYQTMEGAVQLLRIDLAGREGLQAQTVWREGTRRGYAGSVFLAGDRSRDTLFLGHHSSEVHAFALGADGPTELARLDPALGEDLSDLAVTPDGDRLFLALRRGGLVEFRRPEGGWAAFPTMPPPTATATPSPTPTATMVVRSRSWLPRIGLP